MTGQPAEKLGYLGLGMMGFPMARRLLNAGYGLAVWNRSAGKAAALVEAGAKLLAHPGEIAAATNILFSVSPTPPQWRRSYLAATALQQCPAPENWSWIFHRSTLTRHAISPRD